MERRGAVGRGRRGFLTRGLVVLRYPDLYAFPTHKFAKEFNCVQRAHQNTLETWSPLLVLLVVDGLVLPKMTAFLGVVWVAGRVLYGYGYASTGPNGRVAGAMLSYAGFIPLQFLAFYSGMSIAGLV